MAKQAKLQLSRTIDDGTICVWHGDKLVKARKGAKRFAGIWTRGMDIQVLTPSGAPHVVQVPCGLVTHGPWACTVHAGKE